MTRYPESLRSAVAACGAPYGYTLSIWTSGALLIAAHGLPNLVQALSFMVGSVAGYALVGTLAFGNLGDPGDGAVGRAPALRDNVHVLSIGGAIPLYYPASYLLPLVVGFTLATRSEK